MTLEALAEVVAAGLAMWAAWRSLPRPPALDEERLLKVTLSSLLLGEQEGRADLADEATRRRAWEEAVVRLVPYHPAARRPEDKLLRPDPAALPSPALEGERALVEALARLPDPAARWRRMFAEDPRALDVLLSDPAELGEDYDPEAALGQGAGWPAVAAWQPAVPAALQRRLAHVVAVVFSDDPARVGLGAALQQAAGLRGLDLPLEANPEAVAATLSAPSDRLVFFGIGEGAVRAARLLHESPELRDRTLAVLALGGALAGTEAARDFFARDFSQDAMDTEINRQTPYLSIPLVDPSRSGALAEVDWAGQRWPEPLPSRGGRTPVRTVALGPLPPAWLEEPALRPLLARALWVLLAFLLRQG